MTRPGNVPLIYLTICHSIIIERTLVDATVLKGKQTVPLLDVARPLTNVTGTCNRAPSRWHMQEAVFEQTGHVKGMRREKRATARTRGKVEGSTALPLALGPLAHIAFSQLIRATLLRRARRKPTEKAKRLNKSSA